MIISLFFSLIIYKGATFELGRIENMQRIRRPSPMFLIDPDIIRETKHRIFLSLLTLNGVILIASGLSGYFLAGKTLKPISKMMDDQKEFVGNASHELRTPLTALKSEIEVGLRDKKLNLMSAKKLLISNLDDINNMTRLSNYLLKLNRFQVSKLNFKKVDLSEIVKKVTLKRDIKLFLEKTIVSVDSDSVSELVTILVDNAIKYGNNKKISISLKNKTLKVVDHGIGISDEDLPHIFDRFYRGKALASPAYRGDKQSLANLPIGKARNHDGYGLGLSIAKQIADLHGAKIKVESKLGVGTTFKVFFS